MNGLCFRIRVFPINTFYLELFEKCVNCRYHTKKCQHRQGKHKAYKKRKSKILRQPHFDFIKLFVDLFRIWQFWGWLTNSLEWKYEEHMYLSFAHFADLLFFGLTCCFINYSNLLIAFFIFPPRKYFQFLQFHVNWTSKNTAFSGLGTAPKRPVLKCQADVETFRLRRSFVTHKKDR